MSKNNRLLLGFAAPAIVVILTLGYQERGSGPGARVSVESPFDAERSFADLEAVVAFGARPSGSENLARTREYIVSELENAGLEPQLDMFIAQTPIGEIEMANVRAIREGTSGEGTIALAGHYDTKRFDFSFLGANDGGSSTAVVLELARITANLNLAHDLEFLFFDGEEAVLDWTPTDSVYGSRYDVSRRLDAGSLQDLKTLVLVDMIGDSDLTVIPEGASSLWLKTLVWDTANRLGYGEYFGNTPSFIDDDHVPYLRAGIDSIDLIDFSYPYWHSPGDTLDKTSADSLKIIGDVLYHALPSIDAQVGP